MKVNELYQIANNTQKSHLNYLVNPILNYMDKEHALNKVREVYEMFLGVVNKYFKTAMIRDDERFRKVVKTWGILYRPSEKKYHKWLPIENVSSIVNIYPVANMQGEVCVMVDYMTQEERTYELYNSFTSCPCGSTRSEYVKKMETIKIDLDWLVNTEKYLKEFKSDIQPVVAEIRKEYKEKKEQEKLREQEALKRQAVRLRKKIEAAEKKLVKLNK